MPAVTLLDRLGLFRLCLIKGDGEVHALSRAEEGKLSGIAGGELLHRALEGVVAVYLIVAQLGDDIAGLDAGSLSASCGM